METETDTVRAFEGRKCNVKKCSGSLSLSRKTQIFENGVFGCDSCDEIVIDKSRCYHVLAQDQRDPEHEYFDLLGIQHWLHHNYLTQEDVDNLVIHQFCPNCGTDISSDYSEAIHEISKKFTLP